MNHYIGTVLKITAVRGDMSLFTRVMDPYVYILGGIRACVDLQRGLCTRKRANIHVQCQCKPLVFECLNSADLGGKLRAQPINKFQCVRDIDKNER